MAGVWYEDGLRFECTRCGNCCTGAPGYVWVTPEEVEAIADYRHEPVEETTGLYTRLEDRRRTLREKGNGDCVFWDKRAGCTVYPVRPVQCRTWPFWASNVESSEAWQGAAAGCPGCGRGELIPVEEITRRVREIQL